MTMVPLTPDDFDSNPGRRKSIGLPHQLEVKVNEFGHAIHGLANREADLRKNIENILRMEGVEYKQHR